MSFDHRNPEWMFVVVLLATWIGVTAWLARLWGNWTAVVSFALLAVLIAWRFARRYD